MKIERTKFFGQMYDTGKQLVGKNVLDGFNCNTNLDIGIENINQYIAQFYSFTQVDKR